MPSYNFLSPENAAVRVTLYNRESEGGETTPVPGLNLFEVVFDVELF